MGNNKIKSNKNILFGGVPFTGVQDWIVKNHRHNKNIANRFIVTNANNVDMDIFEKTASKLSKIYS